MAIVTISGRVLRLGGLHMRPSGGRPIVLGVARPRQIAQAVMEIVDVDEFVVAGAARTTGSRPGRRPHRSGLRVRLALRGAQGFGRTVDAARVLAHYGVSLSVAKRATEALLERRATSVLVPDYAPALLGELGDLCVDATPLEGVKKAALKGVRAELGMSQDQFANAFALELKTVQGWERGEGEFEPATTLLIKLIAAHSTLAEAAAAGGKVQVT